MSAPRYGGWSPRSAPERVTEVTPWDRRGPKRLWNAPAGYVVRESGDVDGVVTLEYLCPVHGRFEARVSRRESPDEIPCPNRLTVVESAAVYSRIDCAGQVCGLTSPWSPSKFNAWQSAGEVKS